MARRKWFTMCLWSKLHFGTIGSSFFCTSRWHFRAFSTSQNLNDRTPPLSLQLPKNYEHLVASHKNLLGLACIALIRARLMVGVYWRKTNAAKGTVPLMTRHDWRHLQIPFLSVSPYIHGSLCCSLPLTATLHTFSDTLHSITNVLYYRQMCALRNNNTSLHRVIWVCASDLSHWTHTYSHDQRTAAPVIMNSG